MNVRLAHAGDVDAIAALHAASWRDAYRGSLSDAFLAGNVFADRCALWAARFSSPSPGQFVTVAETDGHIVGFACAFAGADPEWGTLLDNLHVGREYQGRAIGRQLMHRVASWCLEARHPTGLFLWVLENNSQAQRFYRKLGAVERGRSRWSAPDGSTPATYRYAWPDVRALLHHCERSGRPRGES